MEVKEESPMKGAVDDLDIIGLITCIQYRILLKQEVELFVCKQTLGKYNSLNTHTWGLSRYFG